MKKWPLKTADCPTCSIFSTDAIVFFTGDCLIEEYVEYKGLSVYLLLIRFIILNNGEKEYFQAL